MQVEDVAVRIKTPATSQRRLIGAAIALPALAFVGLVVVVAIWVPALIAAGATAVIVEQLLVLAVVGCAGYLSVRLSSLFLFSGSQVLRVVGGDLVGSDYGVFGREKTWHVSVDRVRGRVFTVCEYAQDSREPDFRPAMAPRVTLAGEHGFVITVGPALTVDEGRAVSEALNRLLESAGLGAERPAA